MMSLSSSVVVEDVLDHLCPVTAARPFVRGTASQLFQGKKIPTGDRVLTSPGVFSESFGVTELRTVLTAVTSSTVTGQCPWT